MISVALATYNGEKYIWEQLQSIFNQNMPVDEVIICDDGSNDKTIEIIDKFISEKCLHTWKLVRNEKNLGYSKNFFKAVSLCCGKYVFLCDQDDVWPIDKVEKILKIFDEDELIYAVSSNYSVIDAEGRTKNVVFLNKRKRDLIIEEVVGSSNIKGCTMCIKRELDDMIVHEDIAVSLQLGHDWYYNFLACLIGRNVVIPDSLLSYRVHGENISLKRNQRKTILATTKEKRVAIFDEMICACNTVVARVEKKQSIEMDKRRKIDKMIQFCQARKEFVSGKYILIFRLISMFECYKAIGMGKKGAVHAMVSDLLYAIGVNLHLRRR